MIAYFNVDKQTRALQPLSSGVVGLNARRYAPVGNVTILLIDYQQ